MKLLIVESPAKSKTIERYLGDDYVVESSIGHIRDLTIKGKGGFGVDIENNFQPSYEVLKEKKDVVAKLQSLADKAEHIYLATDPDREGEAISWHLQEVLQQPAYKVSRVVFNEITKNAVLNAIPNARDIDMDLVHSQESRRILDRIIGFRLSSLLQQKIGSKSAGRVQSVALKLVVDREKEIEAFDSKEYWDIHALLKKDDNLLKAKFIKDQDGKSALNSEEEAMKVVSLLQNAEYKIDSIDVKNRNRSSKPPFITSTLQQDAGARLKYNAKRVMMIAQKLYEGIDLGEERVGLITYMRTDSIRLSDEFIASAKSHIESNYGKNYYKGFKNKNKKGAHVQDAHESIRPTSIERTPEKMKKYLSTDEYKLYTLIYNRAVASLMSDAVVEDTKVNILANNCLFNLEGERVVFDGFLKIYEEAKIDESEDLSRLPSLEIGEVLPLNELLYEQKFTNPPHRYTEARLIRKMEELGIGRPSTYALTMETLRLRSYVTMDKRTFVPSKQGRLTSEQLDLFFSSIINVKYTADMENTLDEISLGNIVWYEEIRKFYETFMPLVENARDNMVKLYPKLTDEFCPTCGLPLYIRRGPFGEFTACSGYPHCKYIKKAVKPDPVKTGIECPLCHEGELVERINVRGRNKGAKFYACDKFPKCRATYSGLPTGEKCSECGSPMIKVEDTVRCGNERCKTNRKKKETK
ncbi:MAG: type I DNA topoisomerase [Bacilli bacterium]|nr:type I DNA topoisomerase [Bacilli bacterium]